MSPRIEITYSGIDPEDHRKANFVVFKREVSQLAEMLGRVENVQAIHLMFTTNGRSISSQQLARQRPASPPESTDATRFEHTIKEPRFSWDQLVLPVQTLDDLSTSVRTLEVRQLVFETYGLKAIEPFPRVCLNFFGPPGTGKTMAAHALARHFDKRIMEVTYADIVSKYFGEGAQNIKHIFDFAHKNNVVLFIDEADSLLSRRLTDTSQSAGQAINSMRSQILTSIEQFPGIVVFATNLMDNYDSAFDTRVRHVEFAVPDDACAERIWRVHLVPGLPIASDISPSRLVVHFKGLCGRDIKNMVIDAAVRAAVQKRGVVLWEDFENAFRRVSSTQQKEKFKDVKLNDEELAEIKSKAAKMANEGSPS